jgi:hypothetical protein
MARDGIADFAYVSPGWPAFPVMAGASLPFLFSNGKGGSAAIDAWYRHYAAKEDEGREVLLRFVRPRHLPRARRSLPTDIKGS